MKEIKYQAVFLDEKSIQKLIEMQNEKLPKTPKYMHCTFKYMPSENEIKNFADVLFGKKVTLKVVGYCSDGKNSGFEVALDPEQESVYTNSHIVKGSEFSKVEKTIPHITVSMSEDAEAIDTGLLNFEPIEETFEITGTGGFFVIDRENNEDFILCEKQNKHENDNHFININKMFCYGRTGNTLHLHLIPKDLRELKKKLGDEAFYNLFKEQLEDFLAKIKDVVRIDSTINEIFAVSPIFFNPSISRLHEELGFNKVIEIDFENPDDEMSFDQKKFFLDMFNKHKNNNHRRVYYTRMSREKLLETSYKEIKENENSVLTL